MASNRLTGSRVQTALFKKLLLPNSGEAWLRQPRRLVAALEALASCDSEVRFTGTLPFSQLVAVHLADHMEDYGDEALAVLCAVARCGGHRALNRVPEGASSHLVHAVAVHAGLAHEQLSESCSNDAAQQARVARAADFFCAIAQMSYRDAALGSLLSGYLADSAEHLHPDQLSLVARAVGASGRESCQSFVLLHALCRQSTECMELLDGTSVVALVTIFGRNDLYDEEFLGGASQKLRVSADTVPAGQLGDAMYAFGSLKVVDTPQLDALCEALGPRVDELSEMDLVRSLKGLVKLRHYNEELLLAFQPVIEKQKFHITPLSLTNLISSFSYFDADSTGRREVFFKSLLHAATSRASRLAPMSIQHVLTAVCRLQGSLCRDALEMPLAKICAQLAAPGVASQVTPIQAVASITALSKLQHRDCKAAAVLASVLAGRGGDVAWSFAPSALFYAHTKRPWTNGPAPNVKRCLSMFDRDLDSSHCVDILHSLQRLDLHGALVSQLVMLICDRLVPQLHELRAREVLVAARALSASRFPGTLDEEALPQGIASLLVGGSFEAESALQPGVPSSWRERAVESCFENLRRHEHFLEVSWQTLLPFKLLCMEVDTGIYGSRRLAEILSPSLLSFVSRLRGRTRAECEAERYRREHADANDEVVADGRAAASAAEAVAGEDSAARVPGAVLEYARHRLVVSTYVQDFPVDLLIESYA